MFTQEEENPAEQSAKFLIETIRKAMKKGDLKGALRRANRVESVIAEPDISRLTAGELLLTAAGVARCCGKKEKATELVMEILHGKGGMSIEILGRAKRLRARLLLDEGKLDEAEVLAGTADRYIVTGLMEERVEHSAGRELRVNVPIQEKILDKGEFISFETYFLLAEIAILEDNWEKAIWNINSASEKYNGERHFPELEMWRGILEMARGGSFIEVIEPVLSKGEIPEVLVGRIEALLGEERREDSQINESEYARFRRISEKARQHPLVLITENSEENENAAQLENYQEPSDGNIYAAALAEPQIEGQVIRMDLSRLSLMRLVEICDIEKVTGKIMLDWNELAVREGIEDSILDGSVSCGKGIIYCQEGKFIDAELINSNESPNFPPDQKERSRFCLQQMILITLGAGSKLLEEMQSGGQVANQLDQLPSVIGRIIREPDIADRENSLQILNNLNFFLDVSKVLDERRGGIVSSEETEINWDAEWGQPAAKPEVKTDEVLQVFSEPHQSAQNETTVSFDNQTPSHNFAQQSGFQSQAPVITEDDDLLNLDELLDLGENNLNEEIDVSFAALETKISAENNSVYAPPTNISDEKLFGSNEVVEEIAPPWERSAKVSAGELSFENAGKTELYNAQPLELSLNSEEINALLKGETWNEVNNSIARMLSGKFGCGIRTSISRESEEFIVAAAGDSAEPIAETTAELFESKFSIVERIEWMLKADRELESDEIVFTGNVIEMGKLALLNLDHSEGKDVQSIGGVAIAGDEWLAKFMVPPRSLVMRKKINEVQVYARQDGISLPKAHILLGGETGTGKDVFARLIHEMSGRREMKFVRADMGAVGGGDQFIATLFGAVKGSYTGQVGDRRGLVEEAENGTLFLNEIGNLSLESQRALLDFMQEGVYTRLGDTKLKNANVRVILATNENINDATKFRQDVKFRCAPPVILPPLRDRREDIAALALSFAGPDVILREAAIKMLEYQTWSGNVRELSQVIRTAVARIGGEGEIKASVIEEVLQNLNDGQLSESPNFPVPFGMTYSEALEAYEKFLLDYSLAVTGNKKSNAAKLWGESPASITKKIKKWNLREED